MIQKGIYSFLVTVFVFFFSFSSVGQVENPYACNCVSFSLVQNKIYFIEAWVKEEVQEQKVSYDDAEVQIDFRAGIAGANIASFTFQPSGQIIDGWQRIRGRFTVPQGYENIVFKLTSNGEVPVYFDDIRVYPIDSNLKSFVYDPTSLKLMAELDENNYASFYEYDNEGGLVRVKKETEKGVYTIQETRSKTKITQ